MSTLNPIFQNQKAQKVEVVNELSAKVETSLDNPLYVSIPQVINSSGNALQTVDQSSHANEVYVKPVSGRYNVQISVLFLQDTLTSVLSIIPINQNYFNLSTAQISALESSFHTWNLLYPATTTAKVLYSTISNDLSISQVVYSLQ